MSTSAHGSVDLLPRFWLEISTLTPSNLFRQRQDGRRHWLPPRRKGANVKSTNSRWYKFERGVLTIPTHAPDNKLIEDYKTYSFYFSHDRLFIYPSDASENKVGDGTGNPRIREATTQDDERDTESSESDDENTESDPEDSAVYDWRELGFTWQDRGHYKTSHAVFRGENVTLSARWPGAQSILELLPNRNHATPPQPQVAQGEGGFTGEVPILVALIVYSVFPNTNTIDQALQHCFRATYQPHGMQPGQGWITGRGVLVRVCIEKESSRSKKDKNKYTALQKVQNFEAGGCGRFVY